MKNKLKERNTSCGRDCDTSRVFWIFLLFFFFFAQFSFRSSTTYNHTFNSRDDRSFFRDEIKKALLRATICMISDVLAEEKEAVSMRNPNENVRFSLRPMFPLSLSLCLIINHLSACNCTKNANRIDLRRLKRALMLPSITILFSRSLSLFYLRKLLRVETSVGALGLIDCLRIESVTIRTPCPTAMVSDTNVLCLYCLQTHGLTLKDWTHEVREHKTRGILIPFSFR